MSQQDRLDAEAQRLRAQGLTYREVGERMGESKVKAWKRYNRGREREHVRRYVAAHREELRTYRRRYNRENRGTCTSCGGPMGIGQRHDGVCLDCRVDGADVKYRKLERLWAEGKTLREIQAEMGWSESYVSVRMHRAREYGYDLPYRYRGYDKFLEQVRS